jgi:hypothetical protein
MYRIQVQTFQGWAVIGGAPVDTEKEAWELLAAWERRCPRDRFRWMRQSA